VVYGCANQVLITDAGNMNESKCGAVCLLDFSARFFNRNCYSHRLCILLSLDMSSQ